MMTRSTGDKLTKEEIFCLLESSTEARRRAAEMILFAAEMIRFTTETRCFATETRRRAAEIRGMRIGLSLDRLR